jgi:hypothetical protein
METWMSGKYPGSLLFFIYGCSERNRPEIPVVPEFQDVNAHSKEFSITLLFPDHP